MDSDCSVEGVGEGAGHGVSVRWPEWAAVGCPQCGKACGVHDRRPERTWQHLSLPLHALG